MLLTPASQFYLLAVAHCDDLTSSSWPPSISLNLTAPHYGVMNHSVLVDRCLLATFTRQPDTQESSDLSCGYQGGIGRLNLPAWI
jgi:hypothetical protein